MNTPPSSNGSVNDLIQAPTSAVMYGRQAIDALEEALRIDEREEVSASGLKSECSTRHVMLRDVECVEGVLQKC